jgi:aminopeptidase-like protein
MNLIQICKELYPIYRSITGNGVRESLNILQKYVNFKINEIPSGTKVFDWIVPEEWNIKSAFVVDLSTNECVINFNNHNLHVVGYSEPIDKVIDFNELNEHLYFNEKLPSAIPYVTSYYNKNWGFCLSFNEYLKLNRDSKYRVFIDSNFNKNGSLTYAELVIPGKSEKEIFFSSYICHPQMCNNELSGPVVLTALANYISSCKSLKYTYRFVLIPETIGSIAYLSKNITKLKKNVIAGYNLTCLGDEGEFSYIPSRLGNTLSDKIALNVLKTNFPNFVSYTWLDRGSDERQYCAPGIDLPICSITRTKYGRYPEYHTSLDDFNVISENALQKSVLVYKKIINILETDCYPCLNVLCEPQLGKRGLYPNISTVNSGESVRDFMNFISYCDGNHSLVDISNTLNIDYMKCMDLHSKLSKAKLLK